MKKPTKKRVSPIETEQKAFQKFIETRCRGGLPYLDAVTEYMEQKRLEPQAIVRLLNKRLITEITKDAKDRNLLKKGRRRKHK